MHPVVKLIAQRLALGLLLLWAASVLIFVGTEILPGDVAQNILGQSATPQALENLRAQLGLNEPPLTRYFSWFGGVLQGDLGTALSNGQDIATSMGKRLGNTLFLAFWAAVVAVPLAIVLGIIAVRYRNRWPDKVISTFTLATVSVPEFLLGYIAIFFLSVQVRWLPSLATIHDGMSLGEKLQVIALPVLVLVLTVLGHMMRMTRAAILNVMQSAYVETAELKGLRPINIIARHALSERDCAGGQRGDAEPCLSGRRRCRRRGGLRLSRHGPVPCGPRLQARCAGGAGLRSGLCGGLYRAEPDR